MRTDLQCVVLAGGLGTRLGSLTESWPKPMLTVAQRPFLEHVIRHAARFGIKRFLILASFHSEVIQHHFEYGVLSTPSGVVKIELSVEPRPLGTAGALRHALHRLDEQFLLVNGDTYFGFNWMSITPELPHGILGRLALRHVDNASRFGVVSFDDDGGIRGLLDRPIADGSGLINGGVYQFRRELIAPLPAGKKISLEIDVLPKVAESRQLLGKVARGEFIDIGVPEDFERAQTMMGRRKSAVFFDRDGVLNEDFGYVHKIDDFQWRKGARDAIREVNERGHYAFVVTNQAGVARGYYSEGDVRRLHQHMQSDLATVGAFIDDFRYCPHHEEAVIDAYKTNCHWRKPHPGMLFDLCARWNVDMAGSALFGDKASDIEAGVAAGVKSHLVSSDSNLHELVRRMLN